MDALVAPIDTTNSAAVAALRGQKNRVAMEKAAQDFEAVFMGQMLKPMWEGVETDPVFGGGVGEDVMKDLLVQEYGKAMVRTDQHGLSSAILGEMIRMQEKANNSNAGAQL